MVAGGTHERLRIHWGASRECKGQVVLPERLRGGEGAVLPARPMYENSPDSIRVSGCWVV